MPTVTGCNADIGDRTNNLDAGSGSPYVTRPQTAHTHTDTALAENELSWGLAILLTHWPVLVDVLGDVRRRIVRGEEEFFRLSTDQDQPEIDLLNTNTSNSLDITIHKNKNPLIRTNYRRDLSLWRPRR